MTWRARAYLIVTAIQNVLIGISCIVLADTEAFDGDAFQIVKHILSMPAWGLVFIAGGAHLMYAAIKGSELHARIAMPLSAVTISLWAMGFALAWQAGGVVSPVGAIFATSLTVKDLIVCAHPLRSPFEPLVQEYAGPSRGR